MDLAAVHELCLEEIRSHAVFLSRGFRINDCGGNLEELSRLFQGLGICHLLEFLDINEFRQNLVRSGHARRYFLRASRDQRNTASKYLALSRSEAFLDCLVAGDLPLARSIAELSLTEWNSRWEYEDDFAFYRLLHQLVQQAPRENLQDIVLRLEMALNGAASPRLAVARALISGDVDAFETGLGGLLEEEQDWIGAERVKVVDSKFLFWPRSFISIEALALLRAAELVGMPVHRDFPLCPPEARLPIESNDYYDFFAELGALLAG